MGVAMTTWPLQRDPIWRVVLPKKPSGQFNHLCRVNVWRISRAPEKSVRSIFLFLNVTHLDSIKRYNVIITHPMEGCIVGAWTKIQARNVLERAWREEDQTVEVLTTSFCVLVVYSSAASFLPQKAIVVFEAVPLCPGPQPVRYMSTVDFWKQINCSDREVGWCPVCLTVQQNWM